MVIAPARTSVAYVTNKALLRSVHTWKLGGASCSFLDRPCDCGRCSRCLLTYIDIVSSGPKHAHLPSIRCCGTVRHSHPLLPESRGPPLVPLLQKAGNAAPGPILTSSLITVHRIAGIPPMRPVPLDALRRPV